MAQRNKLSDKDKQEIIQLHSTDKEKYTKYRLAVMYGVDWATIHRTIDEPARLRNIELTKQRYNKKARGENN